MLRWSAHRWPRGRRRRPDGSSRARTDTRPRRVSLLLVLLPLVAGACVANVTGPVRTTGTYAHKAAATAASTSSSTATAGLAARAGADGDAAFPYLSILIGDAEDSFGATRTTFESIQPPSVEAEGIRDQLGELLDAASADITDARIAIRRGDRTPLAGLAERLADDAAELAAFEEVHR